MNGTKVDALSLLKAIDENVLRVRTKEKDLSFNELLDMYVSDELIIDPDFQRLFRWSEEKQSQFIESLILELPIPPIYVIEIEDNKYELIDGLQRLSSYFHFRGQHKQLPESKLTLVGCDVVSELNGMTHDSLPGATQIRLKRQTVRTQVFRKGSDAHLRYHMFKRLNTGGEVLSRQEIRNCTIRLLDDSFNKFLKMSAQKSYYINCMAGLTDEKREQMYMEEYVLRFFAMKNNRAAYVKDIGDFLTHYMEQVAEGKLSFDYAGEEKVFGDTFRFLSETLGESVFSGMNKQGTPQGYFSALVFEALSVGIQKYLAQLISATAEQKQNFKQALQELKKDAEFQRLTKGGGKNYAAALQARIEFVETRVAACLK